MKPGIKKHSKSKVSKVKLQKQIAAVERKLREQKKYYEEKMSGEEQKHKDLIEREQDVCKGKVTKLVNTILDLKDEKSCINKVILEQREQIKRLQNENQLLYQMMEKKPKLLDKIKQKFSK